MRGCCIISFKLYWEFRQRRPNRRPSYSSTTVFKDDCCCSFNMQRLSCCALTGSYCHSTKWRQQRCAVNLQHPLFSVPLYCRAFLSLRAIWPIHVLCNRRCYLAAVFCDVEWLLSEGLPDMFLLPCLLTYSRVFNMWKLAIKFGVEGPLIWHVHKLPGRTQLMGVLLQHLIFDRTLNNRRIALCTYLYQQ